MAYKQKGINFGRGTGSAQNSTFKKAEWTTNEAGYDVKRTTRKNLFGRDRVVEKYFDPETGEKLGKQVTVDRGKNDPRAKKVKTKRTNRGWTAEGGVGKIRVDDDYFGGPGQDTPAPTPSPTDTKSETDLNREQRAAQMNLEEGYDFDVTTNPDGSPEIGKYRPSFDSMKIDPDTGRKINPRNDQTYEDSEEGYQQFVDEAEAWWDEQARLTNNKKLEEQDQDYGLDEEGNIKYSQSPNTYKKRWYIMKRKRK